MAPPFDTSLFHVSFGEAAGRQGFQGEKLAEIEGNPVCIWRRPGQAPSAPTAFVSAGIHGDEPSGPEALLSFMRSHPWPRGLAWVVAPALNPSGLTRGTRLNRDGIDLNRDFYRLHSLEIRSLTDWWQRQPCGCALHLSLHEDWEASGFYLYEINTGPVESFALRILEPLSGIVPLQQDGPVDDHGLQAPGLIVHPPEPHEAEGWPEAMWLVKCYPTLSYTIEAPGRLPYPQRLLGLEAALRESVALAAERLGG